MCQSSHAGGINKKVIQHVRGVIRKIAEVLPLRIAVSNKLLLDSAPRAFERLVIDRLTFPEGTSKGFKAITNTT